MAKNKSTSVTLANIIATVGLVLLLVFTFIGHSYMSGGELGWDIIIAVGITAFTALLLWFMIKAKGAENDLGKWRVIEYSTLAVYIIFAIPVSLYGGIMHFFVVNDNKEEIKQYARDDLYKIDNMLREYKEFESEAIHHTATGLTNATRPGQIADSSLMSFMEENNIQSNRASVNNYEMIKTMELVGDGFDSYYDNFRRQQSEIESVVDSWSVMQIPAKAKLISELANSAEKEINELSQNANLPDIVLHNGIYSLGGYQKKDFSIDGSFKFKKALEDAAGFSLLAILVVLLIHLLILFNYFTAYRTKSLGISKTSEDDGGIRLR